MNPSQLDAPIERILPGKSHWWFLGPGGVARLRAHHLTPEGTLQPDAERYLRDQGLFDVRRIRSYSLTVLTSTDCNLGCAYCFQNTAQDLSGGNRPPRIAHARLTSATIGTILDFAAGQMAREQLDQLNVTLFGGEPLLNPRGCVELLTRAADYGLISASMISNLTLLTPRLAAQLAEAGLRSVQVTFDGDREDHDQIRVRRSNGGTFDSIVRNLAKASQAAPAIRWHLRVNFSHHNYRGINNLIDRLADALDTSRCLIYFSRVNDVDVGYGNELPHSADLAAEFANWKFRALDLGFKISRPSPHMPCPACSFRDGRYGAVISADGALSSCWETAGKPDWTVGTVVDGYLPAGQTGNKWLSCDDNWGYSPAEEDAVQAFKDRADAAVLDHLSETGRL
jgi:uncharacterized protein